MESIKYEVKENVYVNVTRLKLLNMKSIPGSIELLMLMLHDGIY
jgi:hypothetical protein